MAKLIILPPAARYLKKLKEKPLKDKFKVIIEQLLLDPYLGDPKTGDLSGVYCCDIFYNKTNYELAYTVIEKSEETIVVILAGTRENFYEELKRYMQHPRKQLQGFIPPLYLLRGGFNYKKMNLLDKTLMYLLVKSLEFIKKEKLDDDSKGMIATYGRVVDFTNRKAIVPIINAIMEP